MRGDASGSEDVHYRRASRPADRHRSSTSILPSDWRPEAILGIAKAEAILKHPENDGITSADPRVISGTRRCRRRPAPSRAPIPCHADGMLFADDDRIDQARRTVPDRKAIAQPLDVAGMRKFEPPDHLRDCRFNENAFTHFSDRPMMAPERRTWERRQNKSTRDAPSRSIASAMTSNTLGYLLMRMPSLSAAFIAWSASR